jgi:hypothetical protein
MMYVTGMHCKPIAVLALALAACGPRPETQVRFETGSDDFWALPLPSELRLQADGTYDLERYPGKRTDLSAMWLRTADKRVVGGWSTTSGVFFTTTAALDPSTLTESSAYLVDVDDASPEKGRRFPLQREFTAKEGTANPANLVGLIPALGFPRRPNTTYAAVLTDAVTDVNGLPLGRSTGFDAALTAPAFDALRSFLGRDALAHVAGATVFRTFDPSAQLKKLVAWEEAQPAPVLADTFTAAQDYDAYHVVVGHYDVPKVQSGDIPGHGLIEWDQDQPKQSGTQRTRVVLAIPKAPMPAAGYPLLIYFHGSGGDAYEGLDRGPLPPTAPRPDQGEPPPGTGPAKYLSERGIATLGFEFPLHGLRKSPPDTTGLELYNLFGDIDGTIDNMDVSAMEAVLVSRLAPTLTYGSVKFDPSRITALTHSMGSTIGIPTSSVNPYIKAYVFSGSGGSMIDVALDTDYPQNLKPFVELLLGFPDGEHLWPGHPLLHVFQMLWDLTDPTNKARYTAREAPASLGPRPYLQFAGQVDGYFHPLAQQSVIVPLGGQLVGDVVQPIHEQALELDGRKPASYPLSGNLHGVTAGVVQYQTPYELGHFVAFDVSEARHQYLCFVQGVGASIVAPAPDDQPCQ